VKTLSEIALFGLPILERLHPTPLDAPLEIVVKLSEIATALEKLGKKDLANQTTCLLLAIAPISDFEKRPDKLDVFALYLAQALERSFKGFLE
jgi:hypothetical protein